MLPAVVIRVFKSLVVSYRLVEIGCSSINTIQFMFYPENRSSVVQ